MSRTVTVGTFKLESAPKWFRQKAHSQSVHLAFPYIVIRERRSKAVKFREIILFL